MTVVGIDGSRIGEPVSLTAQNAADTPLVVKGAGSQSGDLVRVETSLGAIVLRANKSGYLVIALNAAPADADIAAGEAALWFDDTDAAGKLMVKAKTANGTVATGSVTLT